MTNQQFAAYVRLKTKTNSVTLTDVNLLMLMNIEKDIIAGKLVDFVDEEYFGVPETTDLVNSQREYPLPTDLPGKIKKVEAVLDPTNKDVNGNVVWVDLKKFDLTQYNQLTANMVNGTLEDIDLGIIATTDEPTIQRNFGNRQNQAAYMIFRNSIWIFSGALTGFVINNNYLKIWGYEWPKDISDLTLTTDLSLDPTNQDAGLPRQVHIDWADRVVLMWKQTSDQAYQMDDYEAALDDRMQRHIMSLVPVVKGESFTATQPVGGHIYNDGFDL